MMRRLLVALSVLAAPLRAEPLVLDNNRLFIRADVNGVPTEALLDSAAEATLIDPAFASKAKLAEGTPQAIRGSGGESKARIVEGVEIRALGEELHPEAVVVTDLSELSRRLIKRPTQVVLGRELFDAARLRIDIPGREIAVVAHDGSPRGARLLLTAHAGVEAVPARANGQLVQAEFDLGNGSDVLISRKLVKRLRLRPVGRKAGGGIGGLLTRDIVTLRSLDIAGKRFRNVTAAVDDQSNANDLNIGTAILKHFLITTDFSRRAVWLQPVESVR